MSRERAHERSADSPYEPRHRTLLLTIVAVCLGLFVTAVVAVIWAANTKLVMGAHVTRCGVDAQGPYAEVRVTSVRGALGSRRQVYLDVRFAYGDYVYSQGESSFIELTGLHTYGQVYGKYPSKRLVDNGAVAVPGHTVLRARGISVRRRGPNGFLQEYGPGRLVTQAQVEQAQRLHPRSAVAHAHQEVVPDDTSKLRCILYSAQEPNSD